MAIQSHSPTRIGTGGAPNLVGDWAVLIPEVTDQSIWAMIHYWFVDVLPSATVMGTVQLELGVGPIGEEVRKWKSFLTFQSGSELEFDDSGHTKYVPYNFLKGQQISGRYARLGSVDHNLEIQLQIFS